MWYCLIPFLAAGLIATIAVLAACMLSSRISRQQERITGRD